MSCVIQTLYRRLLKLSRVFDCDAARRMLLCSQVEIASHKTAPPLQAFVDATIRNTFHRGAHFYFPISKKQISVDVFTVPSLENFLRMCFTTYPKTSVNIQNAFACLQRLQSINYYFEKENKERLVLSSFQEYCRCMLSQSGLSGSLRVTPFQRLSPFNFVLSGFTGAEPHPVGQFSKNETSPFGCLGRPFSGSVNSIISCIPNKLSGQRETNLCKNMDSTTSPLSGGIQLLLAHPSVRDKDMFAVVLLVSVSLSCKEAVGFVLNAALPSTKEDPDASGFRLHRKPGHALENTQVEELGSATNVDLSCVAKGVISPEQPAEHPIFAELRSRCGCIARGVDSSHDKAFLRHDNPLLAPEHLIHCVPHTPGAIPLAAGLWLDGDKDFLLTMLRDGTALMEDFIVVHRSSIRYWTHGTLQKEIHNGKWLLLQSKTEDFKHGTSEPARQLIFTLAQSTREDNAVASSVSQFDSSSQHFFSYGLGNDNEELICTGDNGVEDERDGELDTGFVESAEMDGEDNCVSAKQALTAGDDMNKEDNIDELEGARLLSKLISEDSPWSRYHILSQMDPEDLEMWSMMAAWSTADEALTIMEKSWRLMYYIVGPPFDLLSVQRTFVPLPMLDEDEETDVVGEWRALALREF